MILSAPPPFVVIIFVLEINNVLVNVDSDEMEVNVKIVNVQIKIVSQMEVVDVLKDNTDKMVVNNVKQ